MSMPDAKHADHDQAQKLWSLIKEVRYPVITTHRSDGGLQSRPMTMQNRDSDPLDFLWFFAPRDSDQVAARRSPCVRLPTRSTCHHWPSIRSAVTSRTT